MTDFHILLQEVNGRNMNGTVLIPNPTVMTIDMVCLAFLTLPPKIINLFLIEYQSAG